MPAQTTKDSYIFPDGTELAISLDDVAFTDMGAFTGGVTVAHNFDKIETELGNKAKVCARVKNQTMAVAPTPLVTHDLEALTKIGGGMYNYTAIAGTAVPGATQTATSGTWNYNKFIKIENQNYDISAITVNSVTGGTDGLLVVDTDYYIGQNAAGEYGIFVIDSATVTTEAQDMVIDYDYTPSSGKQMTGGDSSIQLSRYTVRLRHYTDDAKTIYDMEMLIFKSDVDAGLQFNFKGVNEDGLNEITMAFTGNVDDTRTSGEQLFKLFVADSALVSC